MSHGGSSDTGTNAYPRDARSAIENVYRKAIHSPGPVVAGARPLTKPSHDRIRDALARLDVIQAEHGDAARVAFDRVAAALEGAVRLPREGWPIVQAANDDVCRCPDCEGRGDAGEGDA